MALVILRVFLTLSIRFFKSFRLGIGVSLMQNLRRMCRVLREFTFRFAFDFWVFVGDIGQQIRIVVAQM